MHIIAHNNIQQFDCFISIKAARMQLYNIAISYIGQEMKRKQCMHMHAESQLVQVNKYI
jgi:hypothetical protein